MNHSNSHRPLIPRSLDRGVLTARWHLKSSSYVPYAQAEAAIKSASSDFGFRLQKALEERFVTARQQCRAVTFMTHQYRHLVKVRMATGKAKVDARKASNKSMETHNAQYGDVEETKLCAFFTHGVKTEIITFEE